jgi:cytochrome P450
MPPVVTGIERIAKTDTLFTDGTKIKKDSMVMACHLVNHIDPALHDDPMVFNPERWLTPESKTLNSVKNLPGCFIPFSIGDRRCPGQKFAMVEAAIFLSQFLTKY